MGEIVTTGTVAFTPAEVRTAKRLRQLFRRSYAKIARHLGGCEAWEVRAMLIGEAKR